MLPIYIVYISIFTSIYFGYFYIRDIFKGKTKPNLASWLIWFIAPVSAGIVSFNEGALLSSLPIFSAVITPFVVILVSLFRKNSYWKLNFFDYLCLILSILSLILYLYFREGVFATLFAILADGIAFIPTIMKSIKAPDTETMGPYISGSFNSLLMIFTLNVFSFATLGFAIYLFIANLFEVFILLIMRNKLKKL